MKVGIIGTRKRDSTDDYNEILFEFLEVASKFVDTGGDWKTMTIVSGGCKQGGDRFAEKIADRYALNKIIHYPDKSKLDSAKMKKNPRWAYAEINYARNTLIANDSDILIASVSDNRKGGTEDTIKKFLLKNSKSEKDAIKSKILYLV